MRYSPVRRGVALPAGTLLVALTCAQLSARPPASAVPPKPDDRTIVHVLNRLGFGASEASVARVKKIGLDAYIEEQLHPDRIADLEMSRRLEGLTTIGKSSRELATEYLIPARRARRERMRQEDPEKAVEAPDAPRPQRPAETRPARGPLAELTAQKLLRAIYSERQLEEVLVDFWFNHFNVFAGKGPVRVYLAEYEREAIRPHVLGKFRTLLGATAASPAMLFYLDNWQSSAEPGARVAGRLQRGRTRPVQSPGDPLAGSPAVMRGQMNAQVRPPARRGLNENYARELLELHTLGVDGGYTQQDVREVARAFTGWTIAGPRQGGPFRFEPRLHDDGEKVVLGRRIRAGGGRQDGEEVLDLLARHPSTARLIATKLARRFVSDTPPEALIVRAARRFTETDGDLREVVRAIVTSDEFFSAETYRAKVKNPFELVASAARATGVDPVRPGQLARALREMGMPLYGAQPPTGYADRAEAWVSSGALLSRMDFAVALARTGANNRADAAQSEADADAATRRLLPLVGDLSGDTRAVVARARTASEAMALVLGSPEFQRK